MDYESFIRKTEEIKEWSLEEQEDFYQKVLEEEAEETKVRLLAYFNYASLFYYHGDFRKAGEILEPFIINYQSYEYMEKMISCMNLEGMCCYSEGEYSLSRFYFNLAFKILKEHSEFKFLTYEYNNIALTYIMEKRYDLALENILLAEKHLPETEESMAAYVYLNKADIYCHLGRLDEAEEIFDMAEREHHLKEEIPYDYMTCSVSLFYRRKDMEKYRNYVGEVINNLSNMDAAEYIDACRTVSECALDLGDYETVELFVSKMNSYMEKHPNENKVGLIFEQLKYEYAKKIGNEHLALKALEEKEKYYLRSISITEEKRVISMDEYLKIQEHLQEAVTNEKQANHAKSIFLSNMSHDIRTPMNAIIGYTELMRNDLHDEKLLYYQDMIEKSGHLLLSIINNVLDMARIESGKMELDEYYDRAGNILSEVCNVFGAEAKKKGISFEMNNHVVHSDILCDTTKIEQIYTNIISNSIKYTPAGGKITIDLCEIPCDKENHVTIKAEITDTGIGMSKEYLPKLFDSFSRERSTTSGNVPGAGLGMAIVKSLVDLMGGTIEVESELGKGTKFTVILTHELAKEEEVQKSRSKESETVSFEGKRILLAEDNRINAEIAETVLRGIGFEVDHVMDGILCVDAMEKKEEGTYDLILMDIQMPNMDGYKATEIIRSLPDKKKASIPIIAMTANAFDSDRKKALACGMNGHISKPISISIIQDVLSDILK